MTWLGLPKGALIAIGAAFIVAGVAALGTVEWRYLPAASKPLDVPLALDHAGPIAVPPFTLGRDGAYDIWLQLDHSVGLLGFGCLTGEPGFEKLCKPQSAELDAHWTLSYAGATLAAGGTDLKTWQQRSAAVPAPVASAAHHAFQAYAEKIDNPSDGTPFYRYLGTFRAPSGRSLALAIRLVRPAPKLAALHPRLVVGLTAGDTRNVGVWATLFCVLCVAIGGFMLLMALVPRKACA
jgi:hypothetical protein